MPIDPSAQRKIQSIGDEITKLHQDHKDQVAASADQVKKQADMLKAKKDQILNAQKQRDTATNHGRANANTSTAGGAHHDTGLSTGNVKEQIDLTQLVAEATGQGGFDYEKKVNDTLKKHGLADKHSKTAGSSADAPDAKFKHNKKEHNLEIKADHKAMFGQIELKHDGKKWDISDRSKEKYPHTAKSITDSGFLKKVNKHWGKPSGDYEKDLQMGNVYHTHHDAEPIKAHYGKDRKTDYIQIGGHGFYHTGNDAAGLGSPELNGKATLRARMKARSKDKNGKRKYGALVVMGLKDADKSHHDLDAKPQKEWIEDVLKGHTILESVLNPQDPHKDYQAKRKALHDLSLNKDVDQKAVQQRRLDLDKEYTKYKKESVEINELSTDLLAAYKTKAATSAREADASGNYAKGDKRFKGINKATTKQFDNDLKKHGQYQMEEVELEEAHKIGDKVIIHKGPKDVVGKTGHVGEIRKRWAGDTKTYTIDHDGGSIQLKPTHFKAFKENVLDWGSILNEDTECFTKAFWSGQQEEPKKNPYAEGTEEYFQYENGYMQGVMKRRVMQTESTAHKTLATFFKNRETANKFATGQSQIPTSQKRKEAEKKEVKESAPIAPAPHIHRIAVTVSDPDHPAVTKRDETQQKFVRVTHHTDNKDEAIARGKKHFAKKGWKVHDAHHVGMVHESVVQEKSEQIDEISKELAGNYYAKVNQQHVKKVGIKPNMYNRLEKDLGKNRKQGLDRAFNRLTKEEVVQEEGEGAVPANNAGDGKIAGFAGDAGKKVKMMSQPLRRKPLPKFKQFVSQEHEEV